MSGNAVYTPYGAYELKAKYQRNLGLGILITLSFAVSVLTVTRIISALTEQGHVDVPPIVITSRQNLRPPPSITRKQPQLNVTAPQAASPRIGIPAPVADDEILDDDVVIATRDELAEIVPLDIISMAGDGEITVDIEPDVLLPKPGDFVHAEILPEFIYRHQADYPRLARQAGITGTVVIWALVDEEGNVIDAVVYKSSGTPSLDEAAVQAAYKSKFKPGIQNGRPVKVPVTYDVEFELTEE